MNPLQTTTTITLNEWMEQLATWKTRTRDLVRLWLLNDLGCQRELANHLGLSDRAIRKQVAKLREDGDLPPLDASDGRARSRPQKQALSSYSSPVPKSSYPSAIKPETEALEEEEEGLNLPTAEELMARVLNLEAENASLREQLKAAHSLELVSDEKRNDTVLAEHFVYTQETGSCDSYKQAQYHLSCFLQLLSAKSGSCADGWEESEFHALSQDLSASAKSCANASRSYRESIDAELAEWKAEQMALPEALTGPLPQLDGKDCQDIANSEHFADDNARVLFHHLDGCYQMIKNRAGGDFLKAQSTNDQFVLLDKAEHVANRMRVVFNKANGRTIGVFADEAEEAEALARRLSQLVGNRMTGGWSDMAWVELGDTLETIMLTPAFKKARENIRPHTTASQPKAAPTLPANQLTIDI